MTTQTPVKNALKTWGIPALSSAVAYLLGVSTPLPGGHGAIVDINDSILIAILVGLGGFLAQLWLRMGKLEDRLEKIDEARSEALDKLSAAASFINRIGLWITGGMKSPMPRPPQQIDEHIDAQIWADAT